jgi:hypothetical protein
MFLWGAISHLLLPIGSTAMKAIPDERKVTAALQATMSDSGIYVFPWDEPGRNTDRANPLAADGPIGLIVYQPRGSSNVTTLQPVIELLSDIACALVAGVLLWTAKSGLRTYAHRVAFVALLGLLPWLAMSVSYWTWYHFPTSYFLGEGVDQLIGFALTGLVLAATVKEA